MESQSSQSTQASHSPDFYKVMAWFETNKTQVVYGAGIAIVLGVIVFFVIWRGNQKQQAAAEAFSKVFVAQMMDRNVSDGKIAEDYAKVAAEHADSKSAVRAQLFAAGNLFSAGKFAEAQAGFQKIASEHSGSALIPQALLGVAASLEAQGKTEEAIAAYREVTVRYPRESVTPQAKFATARLYNGQKKAKEAFELVEDVAKNNMGTYIGMEASQLASEILAAHPELAPKPVIAPPPSVTLPPGTNLLTATNPPSNTAPAKK
jgi:predicted negative regulator of RcsB-dependent stress response